MLIRGTVRTADGSPLSGAVVSFADAPVPVADIGALTDDNGGFAMSAPAAGHYRLTVFADDHRRLDYEVEVEHTDVDLDLELQPTTT